MRISPLVIHAVTPVFAVAVFWSAHETASLRVRHPDEWIVATQGALPTVHPLLPTTELERQLIELTHEPLLRIGTDGRIEPVLAADWAWSLEVTCWFAKEEIAVSAAEHLRKLDADRWIQWSLDEVRDTGTELMLRFANPGQNGVEEVLKELAAFEPLPIDVVRLGIAEQSQSYHEHFMETATEGEQVRRVWFESDRAAELLVCGGPGSVIEEMRQYYAAHADLNPEIEWVSQIRAVHEPVLEIRLKPGHLWPDQTPVTSVDAAATVSLVRQRRIPVPGWESLAQIRSLETPAPDRLRVVYRRAGGAALAAWIGLPILSAEWLERQADPAQGALFASEFPPGLGPFRVVAQQGETRLLEARPEAGAQSRRLRIQGDVAPFNAQVGFATGSLDLYWPTDDTTVEWSGERTGIQAAAPSRGWLMVLWNTAGGITSDEEVRKALAMATDREQMRGDEPQNLDELANSIFPPGLWFSAAQDLEQFSPARAAERLEQAGWRVKGTEGLRWKNEQALRIDLLIQDGILRHEELAAAVAMQWRVVGCDVRVQRLSWSELLESRLMRREFDAAIFGLDFEVSWDQSAFWHSSQAEPEGLNFSGIRDLEVDRLLGALAGEFAHEAMPQRVRDLQDRLLVQHPILPLLVQKPSVVVRSDWSSKAAGEGLTLRALLLPESRPNPTSATD